MADASAFIWTVQLCCSISINMFCVQFACGIGIGTSSRAVTLVSSDVDLQTSALTAPALTPFRHLQARIYPGTTIPSERLVTCRGLFEILIPFLIGIWFLDNEVRQLLLKYTYRHVKLSLCSCKTINKIRCLCQKQEWITLIPARRGCRRHPFLRNVTR